LELIDGISSISEIMVKIIMPLLGLPNSCTNIVLHARMPDITAAVHDLVTITLFVKRHMLYEYVHLNSAL
jgi:hypothetical protein